MPFYYRSSLNINGEVEYGCALKCNSEIKFGYVQTHLNDIFCAEILCHHEFVWIYSVFFCCDIIRHKVKGFSEVRMSFIFNTLCGENRTDTFSITSKMRLY